MKRIVLEVLKFFLIIIISFLLIEFCYRFSIIDFYKPELKKLNRVSDLDKEEVDFLIFGDSFSAGPNNNFSYFLSEKYKDKIFVNTSIIGTGIKQVNTIASSRIKKFKPKTIIYQVYVGNDLVDVDHLSNWSQLSFARNLYWGLSDSFLSLSYINYRLIPLKFNSSTIQENLVREISTEFSVDDYNFRTKLLFKADSKYLDKSINLDTDFENRYDIWRKKTSSFFKKIPKDVNVFVVFIPHCAQVNDFYFNNMNKLGADFNKNFTFKKLTYAFFEKAKSDFESQENIVFLNPLPYFRERDSFEKRLFFLDDPHLNTYGQKVFTEFIEKEVILRF